MPLREIGTLLRNARRQLNLSQAELARASDVSTRLVAELERGQRPNVSLDTALRLLQAVGVTVQLTAPAGTVVEFRSPAQAMRERAARRRATWTGTHVPLAQAGEPPAGGRTPVERISAVSTISRQAFALASSGKRQHAKQR